MRFRRVIVVDDEVAGPPAEAVGDLQPLRGGDVRPVDGIQETASEFAVPYLPPRRSHQFQSENISTAFDEKPTMADVERRSPGMNEVV